MCSWIFSILPPPPSQRPLLISLRQKIASDVVLYFKHVCFFLTRMCFNYVGSPNNIVNHMGLVDVALYIALNHIIPYFNSSNLFFML